MYQNEFEIEYRRRSFAHALACKCMLSFLTASIVNLKRCRAKLIHPLAMEPSQGIMAMETIYSFKRTVRFGNNLLSCRCQTHHSRRVNWRMFGAFWNLFAELQLLHELPDSISYLLRVPIQIHLVRHNSEKHQLRSSSILSINIFNLFACFRIPKIILHTYDTT